VIPVFLLHRCCLLLCMLSDYVYCFTCWRNTCAFHSVIPFQNWCMVPRYLNQITLWHHNPNVRHRIHNSPPPVPNPSQVNPLHIHPPNQSLRSILIPRSHLRHGFSSGLFPSGFPIKTLYTFLPSPMRASCPAYLNLLDLFCLMIFAGE
jgi:hypothetical protein